MNTLITKKGDELVIPEAVNFTELVKRSNTALSLDLQSKLIDTLKTEFTETQQQWYVANLYIYMHYHPTMDYPINLENVYKMIGFANKGNAMKTIKNNFTKDEDYKIVLFHREKNSNGGRPIEDVLLNVDTFKNLCMLVKTDKGKEIRKYYVKLENINHKILVEEMEQKNRLLENKDRIIESNEQTKKVEKHKFLIEKFKHKKCIYIAEITKNLRKVGSSKNIEDRLLGLNKDYGNCLFLDVFECDNFREIEESIFRDTEIADHLYLKPVHNHSNPKEVIQLTDSFTYLHLIEIVHKYLKQAIFLSPDKQLESKKIDFLTWLIKEKNYSLDDIERLSKISFLSDNDQSKLEHEENVKPFECIGYKTKPITAKLIKARSIDKIDPETLKIIETYESIGAVINNHTEEKYCYNMLYRSILRNNVYKNYRWNYHGKKIQPTANVTKMANCVESILKLNKDKTKVIQTFSTKKELMCSLNVSHKQATKILDSRQLFNDFYYLKNSDCIDICKDLYIPKYNVVNAKKIKQTNVETKQEFVYDSMNDVYKAHGLSRQTLRKYINEKKEYCGFFWEYIK